MHFTFMEHMICICWQGMHGNMNDSMSEDKWMMNESIINCILGYILSILSIFNYYIFESST